MADAEPMEEAASSVLEEPTQTDRAKHGKVRGIIYPPPDIRGICDKTASFVAKNGRVFEAKIKAGHANSLKFKFLQEDDPYHGYYLDKIEQVKKEDAAAAARPAPAVPAPVAETNGAAMPAAPTSTASAATPSTMSAEPSDGMTVSKRALLSSATARVSKVPKGPPPKEEFLIYHPEYLSAMDSDIIKLTAQMTATNGRSFLQGIAQRESRNPQFDFLKPTHALFGFFTNLVDSYTKCIKQPTHIKERLVKYVEDPLGIPILDTCIWRLEHRRAEENKRKRELADQDRERTAYLQVNVR